jgi:hypothetical protein
MSSSLILQRRRQRRWAEESSTAAGSSTSGLHETGVPLRVSEHRRLPSSSLLHSDADEHHDSFAVSLPKTRRRKSTGRRRLCCRRRPRYLAGKGHDDEEQEANGCQFGVQTGCLLGRCQWLRIMVRSQLFQRILLVVGVMCGGITLMISYFVLRYYNVSVSRQQNLLILKKYFLNYHEPSAGASTAVSAPTLRYQSHWISLIGYVSSCDVAERDIEFSGIFDQGATRIWSVQARRDFAHVQHGQLICLTADQLTQDFVPNFLPLYTDVEFSIFTWIRPRSIPTELLISPQQFLTQVLAHPAIKHVYVLDYDGTIFYESNSTPSRYNSKMTPIPLGLNFHNSLTQYMEFPIQHPSRQERRLDDQLQVALSDEHYFARQIKVFRDDMSNHRVRIAEQQSQESVAQFRHGDLHEASLFRQRDPSFDFRIYRRNIVRWNAYYSINRTLVENANYRMTQSETFGRRSNFAFVLSPFGGGIDCYRTWEALVFGHIVIVETSPLDVLYADLPVVIVQDWAEVTYENLHVWYHRYFFNGTAKNNEGVRQKLTTKYWIDKMKHNVF